MNATDTSLQQRNWRFLHEGNTALSRMTSYAIRQVIKSAFPGCPDQTIAVRTSLKSILVSPMNFEANDWIRQHERDLMGTMAELAGDVIPLRPEFTDIVIKPAEPTLYVIPELIVAKKGGWDVWRANELPSEQQQSLNRIIQKGMNDALGQWNMIITESLLHSIRLIDQGQPMPLVNGDGPRSMARLDVRFIAPFAIDGNFFIGGFPMLGHGKVLRGGAIHD